MNATAMTATIIFLTILAMGLYLLIASMWPKEKISETSLEDFWKSVRSKQGRFSASRNR
jgi:hypothetical protein